MTAQQQATVSATLGTVTKTATLTVQPAPAAISVLQCGASTLAGGGSVACSVALAAVHHRPAACWEYVHENVSSRLEELIHCVE